MKALPHYRAMLGETTNTSLVGHLGPVPLSVLYEVFGEPSEGDQYKTTAEWRLRFEDGTVATIYDWKESSLYDSAAPSPEELLHDDYAGIDWHVGGKSVRALELVKAALEHAQAGAEAAVAERKAWSATP